MNVRQLKKDYEKKSVDVVCVKMHNDFLLKKNKELEQEVFTKDEALEIGNEVIADLIKAIYTVAKTGEITEEVKKAIRWGKDFMND